MTRLADLPRLEDLITPRERRGEHPRFREIVDAGPDAIEQSLRDYVANAPPEAVRDNPRAVWQTALETLDVPGNAIRNLLYKQIGGIRPSSKEEFLGMDKIYGADFLRAMGWHPDTLIGKAGQFLAGLTLDFITDPLSWIPGVGLAAGTVRAGGAATRGLLRAAGVAGKAARTAEELNDVARFARSLGKGVTVAKEAEAGLEAAAHVRPSAIDRLLGLAKGEQNLQAAEEFAYGASTRAGTPVGRAAAQLAPDDLYRGRRGLTFSTQGVRETPLGSIVAGAPLALGKAVGVGTELAGEALQRSPLVQKVIGQTGAKIVGKPIELLGRGIQAPLDLAGAALDDTGRPFAWLPEASKFVPYREMPLGIGKVIDKVAGALERSPIAGQIGHAASAVGNAAKLAAVQLGISDTELTALAREFTAQAERGKRTEEQVVAPALRARIAAAAERLGTTPEKLGPALLDLQEQMGIVAKAERTGDPNAIRAARGQVAERLVSMLPDVPPERLIREVVPGAELMPQPAVGIHQPKYSIGRVRPPDAEAIQRFEAPSGPAAGVYPDTNAVYSALERELTARLGPAEQSSLSEAKYFYTPNGRSIRLAQHPVAYAFEDSGINIVPLDSAFSDVAFPITRITGADGKTVEGYRFDPSETAERVIAVNAALAAVDQDALRGRIDSVDRHSRVFAQTFRNEAERLKTSSLSELRTLAKSEGYQFYPSLASPGQLRRPRSRDDYVHMIAIRRAEKAAQVSRGELLPQRPAAQPPLEPTATQELRAYATRRGYDRITQEAETRYAEGKRVPQALRGLLERRAADPEYVRLKTAADAAQRSASAVTGRQTLRAGREQAELDVVAGVTSPETVAYTPFSALPEDVATAIKVEARALADTTDTPRVKAALQLLAEGRAGPGVTTQRRRIGQILAGEIDTRTQFERDIGVPERPADPVFKLVFERDPLRRHEMTQRALGSIERGEPNALAERAAQLLEDATGVPFADRAEVAELVTRLGSRTGIPIVGYRSEAHARAGKAVRDAGFSENEATLFDLGVADMRPEHLDRIRWEQSAESFVGRYRRAGELAKIELGVGAATAPDVFHELGHSAFDLALAPADQERFRSLWLAKPEPERVAIFARYLDNTRARYAAGAKLSAAEKSTLQNLTDEIDAARVANPEREGFAQLFAHYATTRRLDDEKLRPLFARAMEWLRNLWQRLKLRDREIDRPIVALLEKVYDRPVGKTEPLFGVDSVNDIGTLVRAAADAGVEARPAAIAKWAASTLTPSQRATVFGIAKIRAKEHRAATEQAIQLGLLAKGEAPGNVGWERLYRHLADTQRGKPSPAWIKRTYGMTAWDEAAKTWRLTEFGQQALDAMQAAIRNGGEPGHVERLTREIGELRERVRAADPAQPPRKDQVATLEMKEQVLRAMGKRITDDPAFQEAATATGYGRAGATAAIVLSHRDFLAPEVADVFEDVVKQTRGRIERFEAEKGLATPQLTTARGLGYAPHYLGDSRTPLGKFIRASGMNWEKAWRAAETERAAGSMTVAELGAENIRRIIANENQARVQRGLPAIPQPTGDAPLTRQIADVLEQFPDLAPAHKSMLARTFFREATIADLNQIAQHTGMSFMDDPAAAWTRRAVMSHYAAAGADFLRAAIDRGLKEGWAVKVAGHGPTPDGFARIADSRFGDITAGYAFSNELVNAFKRFQGKIDQPGPILKAVDWATSKWKGLVLSAFPYTTTNLLSAVFQANQHNAWSYKAMDAAQRMMRDYHVGVHAERPIGEYVSGLSEERARQPLGDFFRELSVDHGAFGKGLYGQELETAVREGVRTDWGAAQQWASAWNEFKGIRKPEALVRGYFRAFRSVNTGVEDWNKIGFVLERLRKGDSLPAAAEKARFALNQSSDLTEFERATFVRAIPFWGWLRGNAVLQMTMAMARPQVTALVSKIRGNLEAAMAGDEVLPLSARPKHVADELGAQVTGLGSGRPEFLNLTRLFPVKELGVTPLAGTSLPATVQDALVAGLHPALKGAVEGAVNRDFYWDRPIEEYPGQEKSWLGIQMSPGTKRIARMVRPLNVFEQLGNRGMPNTLPEAVGGALQTAGVRLFPVDVKRQIFEAERTLNDQIGAVMRDYARARTAAERGGRDWRSDDEVQRLAELYAGLIERREALPLKPLREANRTALRESRTRRAELRQFAIAR